MAQHNAKLFEWARAARSLYSRSIAVVHTGQKRGRIRFGLLKDSSGWRLSNVGRGAAAATVHRLFAQHSSVAAGSTLTAQSVVPAMAMLADHYADFILPHPTSLRVMASQELMRLGHSDLVASAFRPVSEVGPAATPLEVLTGLSVPLLDGSDDEDGGAATAGLRALGMDETLLSSLMPFQRVGVLRGIRANGCVLLGDEMGLGKTRQAAMIAQHFHSDWPLLIVTPMSLSATWKHELMAVLGIPESDIAVVSSSSKLDLTRPVCIITYGLAVNNIEALCEAQRRTLIIDEAHYIKSATAQRTRAILRLTEHALHRILLTGTPVLSRPIELFNLVHAVQPQLFSDRIAFGVHYCAGTRLPAFHYTKHFYQGPWSFAGASHLHELQWILRSAVMIRRQKSRVLSQLPAKTRVPLFVDVERKSDKKVLEKCSEAIDKARKQLTIESGRSSTSPPASAVGELFFSDSDFSLLSSAKASLSPAQQTLYTALTHLYATLGKVKLPAFTRYLDEVVFVDPDDTRKHLIFAHHKSVLDAIGAHLEKKKIGYIRIDGSTPAQERQALCDEFQTPLQESSEDTSQKKNKKKKEKKKKEKTEGSVSSVSGVRVGLLGLTAAGVGLTLHAAASVFFAEAYWNVGQLIQAEDRAHRIGQTNDVTIRYVVTSHPFEQQLFSKLERKMQVQVSTVDVGGTGEFMGRKMQR